MNQTAPMHPIIYAVRNLINKLRQHPETYPIKYYKKAYRNRKRKADLYK